MGVTDKLTCARLALGACEVTEALTTTETTQGGRPVALSTSIRRKSLMVILATKTVMIRPGKTVSVIVKLNATARKLLARFGNLPVTLTITLLQNGSQLTIANTKLTVKPKNVDKRSGQASAAKYPECDADHDRESDWRPPIVSVLGRWGGDARGAGSCTRRTRVHDKGTPRRLSWTRGAAALAATKTAARAASSEAH